MRRALPIALALVALGQPVGLCLAVAAGHVLEHAFEQIDLHLMDLDTAAEHGHSHAEPAVDHSHDASLPEGYARVDSGGGFVPMNSVVAAVRSEIAVRAPSFGTGCDPPLRPPLVLRI
jgi:hypothetical protein